MRLAPANYLPERFHREQRRAGRLFVMSDVTRILSEIEQGNPTAAKQLLPLVYDKLRKLAAAKLCHEKTGATLQVTALVGRERQLTFHL